jgi:hypothetical protein
MHSRNLRIAAKLCYRSFKDTLVRVDSLPHHTNVNEKSPSHIVPFTALADFCQILALRISCFIVHVAKDIETRQFRCSRDRFFTDTFPKQGPPMALSTALRQNKFSPKHKIFLAFALSKAFWQYYESDWMNVEWSSNTIQILETKNLDSKAPFLGVKPADLRGATFREHESEEMSGESTHLHPYPYIFNLGLLLFQLGSSDWKEIDIITNATELTDVRKNNELCTSCCFEIISNTDWPTIALPAEHKARFRRVVEACLPTPSLLPKVLFEDHLDISGRRSALKNCVVGPLLELYEDMDDIKESEIWSQGVTRDREPAVSNSRYGINF